MKSTEYTLKYVEEDHDYRPLKIDFILFYIFYL